MHCIGTAGVQSRASNSGKGRKMLAEKQTELDSARVSNEQFDKVCELARPLLSFISFVILYYIRYRFVYCTSLCKIHFYL